jgi:hypothetical protein
MPYFNVKSSNESAEEMSSKQDLIDAIYISVKSSNYLTICRRNFRANKKSWNESAEEKCEQTKISPKPYIFLWKSSNKSAEVMSSKQDLRYVLGCFRRDFANTLKYQQRIEVGQIFLVFVVKWEFRFYYNKINKQMLFGG